MMTKVLHLLHLLHRLHRSSNRCNRCNENFSLAENYGEFVGNYYRGDIIEMQGTENPDRMSEPPISSEETARRTSRERTLSSKALDNLATYSLIPKKNVRERETYVNPTCRRDAIESDEREQWLEAELEEMNSIKVVNDVYSLVPKVKGMNILGSR